MTRVWEWFAAYAVISGTIMLLAAALSWPGNLVWLIINFLLAAPAVVITKAVETQLDKQQDQNQKGPTNGGHAFGTKRG